MNSTAKIGRNIHRVVGSELDLKAQVFLLPGLFGDEPKLKDLRRRLKGQIRFVTLKFPDIEAPEPLLSSLQAIAQVITDEIVHRQPTGAVSIAGYSFGASVALEVASQLQMLNRTVGYLCILDCAFKVDDLRRSLRTILFQGLTPRGALNIVKRIVEKIDDRRYLRRARRSPEDLTTSHRVRYAFISHFRGVALDGWQPKRCLARGVLILSTCLGPGSRPRWLELCPNLKFVQLSSNHGNLLVGESLDVVVSALSEDFAAWASTQ